MPDHAKRYGAKADDGDGFHDHPIPVQPSKARVWPLYPSPRKTNTNGQREALKLSRLAMQAAKAFGFKGNMAALSADRAVRTIVGESPLALLGHSTMKAEDEEPPVNPTRHRGATRVQRPHRQRAADTGKTPGPIPRRKRPAPLRTDRHRATAGRLPRHRKTPLRRHTGTPDQMASHGAQLDPRLDGSGNSGGVMIRQPPTARLHTQTTEQIQAWINATLAA